MPGAGPSVRSEPETRYVKSGDAHIAYQVVGDGPADLIVVRGYISHVEVAWESPALASFYLRLASFCRLILFDKRGTGLSDRVPEDRLPTLEQRMDDVRAVMEAVGSDRAALFGASEGGPMCLLFAATYPERTLGLLLWGCFARYDWRRSFIGRYWGGETVDDALDRLEREWGDGGDLAAMAPSLAGDDAARRAWGRAQRLSATPTAARALLRMMLDVDVRPLLPAIRVPVVILHRADEVAVDVSHSRYMAEHIPEARYVELPGSDHLPWIGDMEPIVAEIQELVTGTRPEPEPDRVVATVLFVDAPHAVTEGEAAPARERLGEVVRSHVARFRGDMLAARADNFGASFDGPARAIRCAEAIVAESDRSGARCRAGIHTGECEPHDSGAPRSRGGHGRRGPRSRLSGRGAGLADGGRPGRGRGDRLRRSREYTSWRRSVTHGSFWPPPPGQRRRGLRRKSPRCCSGARGTTGRSPSAGGWSACATPRDSDTWPVSCASPTASSTCSICWPATHDARDNKAREEGLVAATPDAGAVLDEPAKQRLPRANRRAGGGDRAGAPLERPRADRARRGRARCADARAGRRAGPGRARPARGLGQRARAGKREQGGAQRGAAPRGAASRAGPATSRSPSTPARSASYDPDPTRAGQPGTPEVTAGNPDFTPTGHATSAVAR